MKIKDIRSSYLKTPVTILEKITVVNDMGIQISNYIEKKSTRGQLVTSNYKKQEFLLAGGINTVDSKELVIRYTDLNYKDRVSINNIEYEILSIENVEEKNIYLSILLSRVSDGKI